MLGFRPTLMCWLIPKNLSIAYWNDGMINFYVHTYTFIHTHCVPLPPTQISPMEVKTTINWEQYLTQEIVDDMVSSRSWIQFVCSKRSGVSTRLTSAWWRWTGISAAAVLSWVPPRPTWNMINTIFWTRIWVVLLCLPMCYSWTSTG